MLTKQKLEKMLEQLENQVNSIRTVLQMFDTSPKEKLIKKAIKRVYWQQTPEGKKKLSKIMKKRWHEGVMK